MLVAVLNFRMSKLKQRIGVIACDMDGTLCKEVCWTEEEVLDATPNISFIQKVNELYLINFIVIYTARRDHLLPSTLQWLRINGVMFHAISNNKMAADLYIDDRAIHPRDISKLSNNV